MLEIKNSKYGEKNYYHFVITTDEGTFEILFAGNFDLYWVYRYSGNIMEEVNTKTFTITKENYYLYNLIEILYDRVRNCNIFTFDEVDAFFGENNDEIQERKLSIKEMNENIQESQNYNSQRLFQNSVIEWHCDDFPYEDSSVLKIAKEDESFKVTFEKSKIADPWFTYSVRIRNSGSRYEPFNILFMDMYNELKEYDFEYHQVHIEEYLYQKRLSKRV